MNSRTQALASSQLSSARSRAGLSPIRSLRVTGNIAATTTTKEPRGAAIDSFSEEAFVEAHRTSRWPAWHRGPLDRLQMPLTRFRE